MMEMVTPNGKVGQVVVDHNSALYKFEWESGGEVPQILQGLYTSEVELYKAWNRYIASVTKKK